MMIMQQKLTIFISYLLYLL